MSLRLVGLDHEFGGSSSAVVEYEGRVYTGVGGFILTSVQDSKGFLQKLHRNIYNAQLAHAITLDETAKLNQRLDLYSKPTDDIIASLLEGECSSKLIDDLLKD